LLADSAAAVLGPPLPRLLLALCLLVLRPSFRCLLWWAAAVVVLRRWRLACPLVFVFASSLHDQAGLFLQQLRAAAAAFFVPSFCRCPRLFPALRFSWRSFTSFPLPARCPFLLRLHEVFWGLGIFRTRHFLRCLAPPRFMRLLRSRCFLLLLATSVAFVLCEPRSFRLVRM